MHRTRRMLLFFCLAWLLIQPVSGQQPATSPAPAASPKPSAEPTPIPLANVPMDIQSAIQLTEDIEANVLRIQSATDSIDENLSNLTSEIDPRAAEDTKLLAASPTLDMLYRIKLTWQDFSAHLSGLSRELTLRATSLEEELARLNQIEKAWLATLQDAKQRNVPPEALEGVQSIVDSIAETKTHVEDSRTRVLTVLSELSGEDTRVRRALASVERSQIRALKDLFVRDSPFIWKLKTGLPTEWRKQSAESFSSQIKASIAFGKRVPLTFLIHALLIIAIALGILWMRRSVKKLVKEKPYLERALPILDLPFSTAFVLTVLLSPILYPQATRLIQALLGTLAIVPATAILRRLLDRQLAPILYALVLMYFLDQLRILAASLPVLARFLLLGQMFGGCLFLGWMLRSRHLPAKEGKSSVRFARAVRVIASIGIVFLAASVVTNIFGYVDLANLLGMIFLRSVYVAALLYTTVRILEGLIIIALEVWPLSSLRIVSLHRSIIQQHAARFLEFLALLTWLHLVLGFFGVLGPLIAIAQATLNASVMIGSLNVSVGGIIAFLVAIWASFLVSRFVRFLLEEDIYRHFFL
ncbi:MAG TPA: hypothetical protein VIS99_09940, partial [Terrimicrobiaceae bacterium]